MAGAGKLRSDWNVCLLTEVMSQPDMAVQPQLGSVRMAQRLAASHLASLLASHLSYLTACAALQRFRQISDVAQVVAPLYAKVLTEAAQTLGAGPAFAALWPAGTFRAPWGLAVQKLYQEVDLHCPWQSPSVMAYICKWRISGE